MRFYIIPPIVEGENRLAGFVPSLYDPKQRVQLIQPGFNDQRQRVGINPVNGQIYNAAQIGANPPGSGNPPDGMLAASEGPNYPHGLMDKRGAQYGPRMGFAYDATGDGKTAIRGGLGAFYNRFFDGPYFLPFVAQQPIVDTPILNFGQVSQLRSSTGLQYPTNVFAADRQGLLPMII